MKTLICIVGLLLCTTALAKPTVDVYPFSNPQQQTRFTHLLGKLRCLVCQNQTLAESDAPLAQDLRRDVYQMVIKNKDNQEIKAFLVKRYGKFVLYQPPMERNTWLLWFGPLLLLIIGGLILRRVLKRKEGSRNED